MSSALSQSGQMRYAKLGRRVRHCGYKQEGTIIAYRKDGELYALQHVLNYEALKLFNARTEPDLLLIAFPTNGRCDETNSVSVSSPYELEISNDGLCEWWWAGMPNYPDKPLTQTT